MLTKFLSLFKRKKDLSITELVELNRLLVKAGRRCNYDLKHSCSFLQRSQDPDDVEKGLYYHERSLYWEGIFSEDGQTDYRDRLHLQIRDLEFILNKRTNDYRKLLAENGIKDTVYPKEQEDIPF